MSDLVGVVLRVDQKEVNAGGNEGHVRGENLKQLMESGSSSLGSGSAQV
jgi:hypothetical protein